MICFHNPPTDLRAWIVAAGILLYQALSGPVTTWADAPRFEMDTVVVTASREEEAISDIPRNITVITAEEIEQATSSHVVDLLAREAGVSLRGLNGSDKSATVDIRGMGARASNNVIVLIDGVRQNSSDLSGADFSSIALNQIERIEILRGSGAVLYGDGAVGGVINIITKSPTDNPERSLYLSYGSFATLDTRASLRDRVKGIGVSLNAGYFDSDGFRNNGFLTKGDLSIKLDYETQQQTTLWVSGSHHQDEYGLPGPVPFADAKSGEKRSQTRAPNDEGETTDQRVGAGFKMQGKKWGTLSAAVGYRVRENPFILGYSSLRSTDDQTSEINEDARTVDLRYTKDYTLFKKTHQIQLGLDHYSSRYIREERPSGPRENSAVEDLGLYLTNQWQLSPSLDANWGYRHNRFDGQFRTDAYPSFGSSVQRWVNGDETDKQWNNDAYDIGLSWQVSSDVTLFGSYATSFRVPNVDELAEAEPGLKPQTGKHIDIGVKGFLGDAVEYSATLFQARIEDELYFSEVNRNYDEPTVRKGIETYIRWYPTPRYYVWANYTYISARFEDSDHRVPLVSEHQVAAGVEWQMTDTLLMAMQATYAGEQFDGNDVENDSFEKLDAYTVTDVKVTWERDAIKLFVSINNLFDAYYATAGYSENYYPMPDRNIYGGVQWRF